jgi:hypothetical protein
VNNPSVPLGLSKDRILLYGSALTLIGVVQIKYTALATHWDWPVFRAGGSLAGTPALVTSGFIYTPAYALPFAPLSRLPTFVGFALLTIIMVLAAVLSGVVASRTYRVNLWFALLCIFAWAPTMLAINTGQSSTLGLLLALAAIFGLANGRASWAGVAAGALLYKSTYALPLIVLLLLKGEWKALRMVGLCAVAWYVLSVVATGGNWLWPVSYVHAIADYYHDDVTANSVKAISIPGVLIHLGVPGAYAVLTGIAVFAACVQALRKAPMLEAASMVGLLGLAASPHAWTYDATLALPAIFWMMTALKDPWKTRLVIAAYLIAPIWLLREQLHFNPLALVTIGATVGWLYLSREIRERPVAHATE